MISLKLSPSKIEKYRQWNEGEYKRDDADKDVITKESLIASITGKEVWTPKAEFGTAFHAVMQFGAEKYKVPDRNLEDGEVTYKYVIQEGNMPSEVVCQYEEIQLADEYHKAHPNIIWEIWNVYTYILDGVYVITMRMRHDGMEGLRLKEHKTTTHSSSDYEFFARSCQWRIYLIVTEAPAIDYERFLIKEPSILAEGKTRRAGARDKREVTHNSFSFFPTDDMRSYVNKNIRGLIRFCESNVDENGESLMKYILA